MAEARRELGGPRHRAGLGSTSTSASRRRAKTTRTTAAPCSRRATRHAGPGASSTRTPTRALATGTARPRTRRSRRRGASPGRRPAPRRRRGRAAGHGDLGVCGPSITRAGTPGRARRGFASDGQPQTVSEGAATPSAYPVTATTTASAPASTSRVPPDRSNATRPGCLSIFPRVSRRRA